MEATRLHYAVMYADEQQYKMLLLLWTTDWSLTACNFNLRGQYGKKARKRVILVVLTELLRGDVNASFVWDSLLLFATSTLWLPVFRRLSVSTLFVSSCATITWCRWWEWSSLTHNEWIGFAARFCLTLTSWLSKSDHAKSPRLMMPICKYCKRLFQCFQFYSSDWYAARKKSEWPMIKVLRVGF